jgi:voltage-gated potassium channel Kch
MKHLEALLAKITAMLGRLGSGTARREANEEVVRISEQGMCMADETIATNQADFAHHSEEWNGVPPQPATPREDPHHAAKARMGRAAEWFLLGLKVIFWVVFGPLFFAVLAWIAVIVAVAISLTLSLGVKPLLAGLILKPGLTPHQQECRLHSHVVAGIFAFGIVFGGLFVLRGLGGPLALIGAMFVLPVLSACDLVLLYLMGIGHAHAHLYGWAAPFVRTHHDAMTIRAEFERHHRAARNRLDNGNDDADAGIIALPSPPRSQGPAGAAALPAPPPTPAGDHRNDAGTAAAFILFASLLGTMTARAQAPQPIEPVRIANLTLDSTTSLFPSVAETMTPIIARAFATWTAQMEFTTLRVSTFERDGWLPRIILQTTWNPANLCATTIAEGNVFRGMREAAEQHARDTCNRARTSEAERITTEIIKAITNAWHAPPLVDPKHGRSCTAFQDLLASTARIPAGNLYVITTDTEETCNNTTNPVPYQSVGAVVIIILVPSKTDMGPGVSAATRFTAKKAHVERIAPWVRAILAPAEVDTYRLPVRQQPVLPTAKVTLWKE